MKKLITSIFVRLIGLRLSAMAYLSPKKAAKKAFLLFCTPLRGRVKPQQQQFLEDAKDQILKEGNSVTQTYKWTGTGPTVLLLHGWESNTFRWRNLIPFLQDEVYTIIAMDAPAHGNSSGKILNVPLYTEAAQKVIDQYKPTYVVGHSIGGMTLLYNLFKYPEKNNTITKAVTLGSPSELSDFILQYKKTLKLNNKLMQVLESYFIEHLGFKYKEFSSLRFIENVKIKGLLIHDKDDTIAPYWSSEQVHAKWKNSTLISTEGLGHSLHQEKVMIDIINFLKS